ncbi:MAG: DoxX family membrane protein [Phycisphaeraceae bacterium]
MESTPPPNPPSLLQRLLLAPSARPGLLTDALMLGVRLYAGITIANAGFDKLPVPNWMVEQVIELNFPQPELFALIACYTEAVGGLLVAFGLLTRPAALLVAFTMGVAAFGYQNQTPILGGIHVAQLLFWFFVAFTALGAGRFSLDHLLTRQRTAATKTRIGLSGSLAAIVFITLNALGVYFAFLQNPPETETQSDTTTIESIAVAGTFNNWDPTANPMTQTDDHLWTLDIQIDALGPYAFKFAANGSWDINLGEADQPTQRFPITGTAEPNADNILTYIPTPATYRITLDSTTYAYNLTHIEPIKSQDPPTDPTTE